MARVVALVPDLLFGSRVAELLAAGGHEAVLCVRERDLPARLADAGARPDVLVVDLTSGALDGGDALGELRAQGVLEGVRTLACYSHVDAEQRARAHAAGFDLVVPRSRMSREGAALVARLAEGS